MFSQNSKLSAMNLKSNLIGQLPPDLSIWSHLKEINLSSNKIEEIPESLGELKNCEELKISNNKIGYVSYHFRFFRMLNEIFSELPKSIGESKKLKILELDENELTWLPGDIGYCQQLQKLILTSNKISCLPTDIGSLKTLTHLYAGLSQALSKMKIFNRIIESQPFLGENQMFTIPPHIGMMSSLKELYINDNPDLQVIFYLDYRVFGFDKNALIINLESTMGIVLLQNASNFVN